MFTSKRTALATFAVSFVFYILSKKPAAPGAAKDRMSLQISCLFVISVITKIFKLPQKIRKNVPQDL